MEATYEMPLSRGVKKSKNLNYLYWILIQHEEVYMDYNSIKLEIHEDKIAVITLNRPEKKNALSIQMRT